MARIDFRKFMELYRSEVPPPVDVLNLLHIRNFNRYRWYALTVAPLLALVGGRVKWMGKLEREFHGEPQADKLLVVRYPNHRRFLVMVANPYYLLINRLREGGVGYFEASFSHSLEQQAKLSRHEYFLVLHFNDLQSRAALPSVKALFKDSEGSFVYSSTEQATIDLFRWYEPGDPNPMALKRTAFFAFPDVAAAERFVTDDVIARLNKVCASFALHLYKKESPRSYMPGLRSS